MVKCNGSWRRCVFSTIPPRIRVANVLQDTIFEEDTEIHASWGIHHREGSQQIGSTRLYSYSLDTAPNKLATKGKHYSTVPAPDTGKLTCSLGIVEVGKLLVNYEDVDLDQFECKMDEFGYRVWRLPVQVFIKLGARQGTFTFRTSIGDKECGVAHMDFSGH